MEPSFDSLSDNGNVPFFVDAIVAPFGIITDEPRLFSMSHGTFASY